MPERTMEFNVTVRGRDGKPQVIRVEASDRTDVFKQLEAKGLSAIKVEVATGKSGNKAVLRRRLDLGFACIFAVIIVVIVALMVRMCLAPKPEKMERQKETEPPIVAKIPEQTPASAPAGIVDSSKFNNPIPEFDKSAIFVPPALPANLDEDERQARIRKAEYEFKMANDQRLRRYLKTATPPKTTFKTSTEQILDWIFTTQIGDVPPPPLPELSEFELNHIDEILDSVNEITEYDDEKTAERKAIVVEVKKELVQFLKEGGKVEDFINYYYEELKKAYDRKATTEMAIHEIIKEGDPELALEFIEKANETLEQAGIPGVELTDDQKDDLAEGLNR